MLSDRLRANIECAPWVIDDVKRLEAELAGLLAERAAMATMAPRGWEASGIPSPDQCSAGFDSARVHYVAQTEEQARAFVADLGEQEVRPLVYQQRAPGEALHDAADTPRPATSQDVDADTLRKTNDALCDFGMRWSLDGDYLRCTSCNRAHLASKADEQFTHASDCSAGGEKRPWLALMEILRPLQVASWLPAEMTLAPNELTPEMAEAMLFSRGRDDEGEFLPLINLLDFSGHNKALTVVKAAYAAALSVLKQRTT